MKAITRSMVEARLRRALHRNAEVLHKTRPGNTWAKANFGDYYTTNRRTGIPKRQHVELETLARELGVMCPGEVITK